MVRRVGVRGSDPKVRGSEGREPSHFRTVGLDRRTLASSFHRTAPDVSQRAAKAPPLRGSSPFVIRDANGASHSIAIVLPAQFVLDQLDRVVQRFAFPLV